MYWVIDEIEFSRVLNRTLAIGICRIEFQISQSELDHVVVYSSAVYVKANSTLSRVVKAASQNFVVSVVYVKFCYSCRENFLLFHSSIYLRSARSSYISILCLVTCLSPIARPRWEFHLASSYSSITCSSIPSLAISLSSTVRSSYNFSYSSNTFRYT